VIVVIEKASVLICRKKNEGGNSFEVGALDFYADGGFERRSPSSCLWADSEPARQH
jgi:hypothetical protein